MGEAMECSYDVEERRNGDLLQDISTVSLNESSVDDEDIDSPCNYSQSEKFDSPFWSKFLSDHDEFEDETLSRFPPASKCLGEILKSVKATQNQILLPVNRYFLQIKEKCENQQRKIIDKSHRLEKIKNIQAELRAKEERVKLELQEEIGRQKKLDQPSIVANEKAAKKLKTYKKNLSAWKKMDRKAKESYEKVLKENQNTMTLLERLGVSLVKNKSDSGEDTFCFGGLVFSKIDPTNPDAEYFINFENFDPGSWTFTVTSAQPTFSGFSELANNFNEKGNLVELILHCKKHWQAIIEAKNLAVDSPGSSELFNSYDDVDSKDL